MDWKELQVGDWFRFKGKVDAQFAQYFPDGVGTIDQHGYMARVPGGAQLLHPVVKTLGVDRYISTYDLTKWRVTQEVEKIPDPTTPTDRLRSFSKVNSMTGTDPEIFATHDDTLLPAFQFLPPKSTAFKDYYSTAYRDGFAAECAVLAVGCHGHLVDYIRDGLGKIANAAKKFKPGAKLSPFNALPVPKEIMDKATDDDVALGCLPSLHAYGDEPIMPGNPRDMVMRFAGGHVHLGTSPVVQAKAESIVKGCDLIAGIPCVALFASFDNPLRRMYYGRAGEYRLPKHGIEYRTLSNAWLISPHISHLVLNLVRAGAKVGYNNAMAALDLPETQVQGIINNCDVPKAREWTLKHLPVFDALLHGDGGNSGPAFSKAIKGGLEAVITDPTDIEGNWKLNKADCWLGHSNSDKATWNAICHG